MDPASAVAPLLSAADPALYAPPSLSRLESVSRSASGFRSVLSSPVHHSVPHSAFSSTAASQDICVLWMFWNSASVYRRWSSLRWSSFRLLHFASKLLAGLGLRYARRCAIVFKRIRNSVDTDNARCHLSTVRCAKIIGFSIDRTTPRTHFPDAVQKYCLSPSFTQPICGAPVHSGNAIFSIDLP